MAFLDTMVTRNEVGELSTEWYCKSMASNRLIHFQSYHPLSQKVNTCAGLARRVFNLSTSGASDENKKIVTDILKNNGYPRKFINKIIYTKRLWDGSDVEINHDAMKEFCTLPYIRGLSEKLKKTVKNERPQTKVAFRNIHNLKGLYSRLKDPLEDGEKSGLCYSIDCECGSVYIGETRQYFRERIKQHRRNAAKGSKDTALSDHVRQTGHKFNFETPHIIRMEKDNRRRKFFEAVNILRSENAVNYRKETEAISANYYNIVKWGGGLN